MSEYAGHTPEVPQRIDEEAGVYAVDMDQEAPAVDSVGAYLRHTTIEPLLTAEDEVELMKCIETGSYARTLLELTEPGLSQAQRNAKLAEYKERAKIHSSYDEPQSERLVVELEQAAASYVDNDEGRQSLAEIADAGDAAKTRMVMANTRLAISIAKKSGPRFNESMDMTDMAQAGVFGLMHAVDKFDYTKGLKFSTYATWWVRQSIGRERDNTDKTVRIPANVESRMGAVERRRIGLATVMGHEPSDGELSADTGRSVEDIATWRGLHRTFRNMPSLNQPAGSESDRGGVNDELQDFISGQTEVDPVEAVATGARDDSLQQVIAGLPEREQVVLRSRYGFYGEPETLESAGARLGVTRERARQLETQGMKRLRALLQETDRDDWLADEQP